MSEQSKEIVIADVGGVEIAPLDYNPAYLKGINATMGMEGISKDDVKTPRIVLLQALSPQVKTFQGLAYPGQFWHAGMNISMGTHFDFVPATVSKIVILFRPRDDQGGGILAFSKDGRTWLTGGNTEFRVKLKGKKEPVVWNTGKDVISSRLTEFGTADPDSMESPPAAQTIYEYLCYTIGRPELSPVVLGVSKTALPNGKAFNTSLMMLQRAGKPIQSIAVRCFVEEKKGSDGEWTVPNFKTMGIVPKNIYEEVQKMAKDYSDYNAEYAQDDATVAVDDEVAF